MINSHPCYYQKNDKVYVDLEGYNETIQDQINEGRRLGAIALKKNFNEVPLPVQIALGTTQLTFEVADSLARDPFFWFYLHTTTYYRPHHGGGGGSCGGCSGGGGGSGDGVVIAALVAAIAALLACFATAVGVTGYQAYKADKTRKKAQNFEGIVENLEHLDNKKFDKTIQVYKALIAMKKEKWADRTAQSVFTAVLAVGFGFLTAAAVIALYAILKKMPISPFARLTAIVGGSCLGAGSLAYAIRPLARYALKGQRERLLQELHTALTKEPLPANDPYSILKAHGEKEKLYYQQGGGYVTGVLYFQDPDAKLPYFKMDYSDVITKGFPLENYRQIKIESL